MQNNSVRSNVWAFATGKCIDFETADGTPQHYCPGHFWHCAYRYQQCGFEFRSNILVSGNSDNDYWHQPAEGYCNVTSSRNLYFNRTGAGLSATFPSTRQPQCPSYACNLHSLNPNASLADWQSRGHEAGSKVADPLFADARRRFQADLRKHRVTPTSCFRLGCGPLPHEDLAELELAWYSHK